MEKDSRSFTRQLHRHRFPSDLFDVPPDTSRLNTKLDCLCPPLVEDSRSGSVPLFPFSGIQPNGSQNWFLTQSHLAFAPTFRSPFMEKLITGSYDLGKQEYSTIGTTPSQKRFLVFDHSGDRTTVCYTSGIETPIRCGMPKSLIGFNKEELGHSLYPSRPIANDKYIDDPSRGITEDDEIHEDTEELNALLCSDSKNYSSDGEEASTAHSPSTMTDNRKEDLIEEAGEEVDSFDLPTKRRKLLDGAHDATLASAGSPLKSHICPGLDDDTGSSCGSGNEPGTDCIGSLSSNKRSRKERIRNTLNVLQNIIPSAKGKNAIVVIDEAIHYLKSLKVKAKAMGLNSL